MSDHATSHETAVADDHAHSGGHGHAHGGRPGWDFAHPFPVWGLLLVFVTLIFLTILTVAQASLDLGGFDVILSMMIATIKAALVVMFFMHLAFDKPFNAIIFVSSLFFVALFIGGTLSDAKTNEHTLEPNVQEVVEPAQ